MNEWGFTLYGKNEKILFEDFGYETEADAEDAMRKYLSTNQLKEPLFEAKLHQKWTDID